MAKRNGCAGGDWNTVVLGDCATHLRYPESPRLNSIVVTHAGGPYVLNSCSVTFPNSGPNAQGEVLQILYHPAYDCSGEIGYSITGINILEKGWHFIKHGAIEISGEFVSGCGTPTDAQGYAYAEGIEIRKNVTRVPPQCSDLWYDENVVQNINNGIYSNCSSAHLAQVATSNNGECLCNDAGNCPNCVAEFESGWLGSDCSEGANFQKTDNYCNDKGAKAPWGKCTGPWPVGEDCTEILNKYQTDSEKTFLDFGACTKRGYKNVTAFKAWQGHPPFRCVKSCGEISGSSEIAETTYDARYLTVTDEVYITVAGGVTDDAYYILMGTDENDCFHDGNDEDVHLPGVVKNWCSGLCSYQRGLAPLSYHGSPDNLVIPASHFPVNICQPCPNGCYSSMKGEGYIYARRRVDKYGNGYLDNYTKRISQNWGLMGTAFDIDEYLNGLLNVSINPCDMTWSYEIDGQVSKYGTIGVDLVSPPPGSKCGLGVVLNEGDATCSGIAHGSATYYSCNGKSPVYDEWGGPMSTQKVNSISYSTHQTSLSETQFTLTFRITDLTQIFGLRGEGLPHSETQTVYAVMRRTLSSPYTKNEVKADANYLLDQWDLTDDIKYPWRTSENETQMPIVTYCEANASPLNVPLLGDPRKCEKGTWAGGVLGATNPNWIYATFCYTPDTSIGLTTMINDNDMCIDASNCAERAGYCYNVCDDLNSTCYDTRTSGTLAIGGLASSMFYNYSAPPTKFGNYSSKILGTPGNTGETKHIDFSFINYELDNCCSNGIPDETKKAYIIKSHGGVIPDEFPHATKVTDVVQSKGLYPGACEMFAPQTKVGFCGADGWALEEGYYVTKYAEIVQLDKPSVNHRLPCGIGNVPDKAFVNGLDPLLEYIAYGCAENVGGTYNATTQCWQYSGDGLQSRWPEISGFFCGTPYYAFGQFITDSSCLLNFYQDSGFSSGLVTGNIGEYIGLILKNPSSVYATGMYQIYEFTSGSGILLSGEPLTGLIGTNVSGLVDFVFTHDSFDSSPKGDLLMRKWDVGPIVAGWDYESNIYPFVNEQSDSALCMPWSQCKPSAIFIVPPGSPEVTSLGGEAGSKFNYKIEYMDMDINFHVCGTYKHYIPQQWNTEPRWIKPSKPLWMQHGDLCQTDEFFYWEEDDGSCKDMHIKYTISAAGNLKYHYHYFYPLRDFVEARTARYYPWHSSQTTPPCGFISPTIREYWGIYTNNEILYLSENDYSGWLAYDNIKLSPIGEPPQAGYSYWGQYAPWSVSPKQLVCIETSGISGNYIDYSSYLQ